MQQALNSVYSPTLNLSPKTSTFTHQLVKGANEVSNNNYELLASANSNDTSTGTKPEDNVYIQDSTNNVFINPFQYIFLFLCLFESKSKLVC
jgi:hypothetical protein